MIERRHPTHVLVSAIVAAPLIAIVLAGFIACFVTADLTWRMYSVVAIFAPWIVLAPWIFFRINWLRCPSCRRWLSPDDPMLSHCPQTFTCVRCQIRWDAGFVRGESG